MAHPIKRLLLLAPRRAGRDRSPADGLPVDVDAMALEGAALGPPPILRPAAIFRQVLFDPAESSPVWMTPRPTPAPDPASSSDPMVDKTAVADSASTGEPKPTKRARRPKANGPSGASRSKSKRIAKPDHGATDD
jgi:hypothetical protein